MQLKEVWREREVTVLEELLDYIGTDSSDEGFPQMSSKKTNILWLSCNEILQLHSADSYIQGHSYIPPQVMECFSRL